MKKTFFTIILLAVVTILSAQSLQFEYEGTVYANNDVVVCTNTPNEFGEMVQEMQLRNLTSETLPVIVEREIVVMLEGTESSFCWGQCFAPFINVSPNPIDLPANSLSQPSELAFHYQVDPTYMGDPSQYVVGTSIFKFYAYPENNPDDKVCLEVHFTWNPANVSETTVSFGQAYPNPATTQINFDYSNNHGSVINVLIYNLLGQEVKSQLVSNTQGRISIAVDDLQPGIYFCSFRVDNEVVRTEKFTVKR